MVEQAALGGPAPGGGPCYGYRLEVLVVVGGNEVSIRRRNGERLSPDEPWLLAGFDTLDEYRSCWITHVKGGCWSGETGLNFSGCLHARKV